MPEEIDIEKVVADLQQQPQPQQPAQQPTQESVTLPNGQQFTGTPEQVAAVKAAVQPAQQQQPAAQGAQASPFDMDGWAKGVQAGDREAQKRFDQHFYGLPSGVGVGDALKILDRELTKVRDVTNQLQLQSIPAAKENPQLAAQAQALMAQGRASNLEDAVILAKASLPPQQQAEVAPAQAPAPDPSQPWAPPVVSGTAPAGPQPVIQGGLDEVRAKTANLDAAQVRELIARMEAGG